MTPVLRRWHNVIWPVIFTLILLLFIGAISVIPESHFSEPIEVKLTPPFINVLQEIKTGNLLARMRQNESGRLQLEIYVSQPLTSASALVYDSSGDFQMTEQTLVGRLSSQGMYRFDLPMHQQASDRRIVIYDAIKKRQIEALHFDFLNK